jgi:acyl-CoA synthetase (AMP-forming)/AMP-acid ligase II
MIRSTMQEFPLTIGAIMRHGTAVYGGSECVTWTGAGARRVTYAEVAANAGRLAGALERDPELWGRARDRPVLAAARHVRWLRDPPGAAGAVR